MRHTNLPGLFFCLFLAGCDFGTSPSNVKISEEPAAGLTQSSLDQVYLQRLAEETRQGAEQSLQRAYERNNVPQRDRTTHARTSGRYEWRGGYKLAVIDLDYSANPMRVIRVVGIVADRLVTISCISPQGAPLDVFAGEGECAEAIAERFPKNN